MNTLRNKVTLVGNLGKAPEFSDLTSGTQVAKMSLATNERYRNKSGEWVDNTQWHTVVAWNKQAERASRLLAKGTEVMIEGRLVNRSYETKTGEKRYSTEVEVNDFLVLSKQSKS